jgi:hypothetical protein
MGYSKSKKPKVTKPRFPIPGRGSSYFYAMEFVEAPYQMAQGFGKQPEEIHS